MASFFGKSRDRCASAASELIPEPSPFGIEPRETFGNPLLLLSNLVYRSHSLYPLHWLDPEHDGVAPVFSMEKYASCSDDHHFG